jgi:hypothetical protein
MVCIFLDVPLPIAAEINGRLVSEGQPGHSVDLFAVGQAPIILPPRGLLREAERVHRHLKAELKRANVTYEELAARIQRNQSQHRKQAIKEHGARRVFYRRLGCDWL